MSSNKIRSSDKTSGKHSAQLRMGGGGGSPNDLLTFQ